MFVHPRKFITMLISTATKRSRRDEARCPFQAHISSYVKFSELARYFKTKYKVYDNNYNISTRQIFLMLNYTGLVGVQVFTVAFVYPEGYTNFSNFRN